MQYAICKICKYAASPAHEYDACLDHQRGRYIRTLSITSERPTEFLWIGCGFIHAWVANNMAFNKLPERCDASAELGVELYLELNDRSP